MIKTNYFEFAVHARIESETRFGGAKLTQSFSGIQRFYITVFDTPEELMSVIESRELTDSKKRSITFELISDRILQRQTIVLSEPLKEGQDLKIHHIFVRTSGDDLPSTNFIETLVEGWGLMPPKFSEAGESIQRSIKAKSIAGHWRCAREMLIEADNRYLELTEGN